MKKKHFVIIRKNRYLFANELLLTDGGILIFDVFSEGIIDDRQESRDWDMPLAVGSGMKVNIYFYHYPENKVFAYQYNLILEDTAKHFIIWERYYSEEEITSILRKVGFRKISIYKELLGKNDFTSSSEFFIVAEKVSSERTSLLTFSL